MKRKPWLVNTTINSNSLACNRTNFDRGFSITKPNSIFLNIAMKLHITLAEIPKVFHVIGPDAKDRQVFKSL